MPALTKRLTCLALAALVVLSLGLVGCGGSSKASSSATASESQVADTRSAVTDPMAANTDNTDPYITLSEGVPAIDGLTYEKSMNLQYADQFAIHYYEGGYKLVVGVDGRTYLIVPEGAEVPAGLDKSVVILQQPLDHVYLCGTSAMALINAIGALDNITMTGTDVSGWDIEVPRKALEEGRMVFAGRYSAPDYEMLIDNKCNLAFESTMILHTPSVQENLEGLGIPVFIERSSYESKPFGRTEWVRLYGAMFNKEDEAYEFFMNQAAIMDEMRGYENTGKTVAFFSINSNGQVVVRRPEDYISQSIAIAGGEYVFKDLKTSGAGTTVKITMEEFYATAVNADYLVYNGTIEQALTSVNDLLEKSDSFKNFKAVKEGNVWVCGGETYQSTDMMAELIEDFHLLVTDAGQSEMTFLKKVE